MTCSLLDSILQSCTPHETELEDAYPFAAAEQLSTAAEEVELAESVDAAVVVAVVVAVVAEPVVVGPGAAAELVAVVAAAVLGTTKTQTNLISENESMR